MANVAVRYVYVMFLEIITCTFLTISYVDLSSENVAGFQWFVALFFVCALIAVIVVIVFLCIQKGGLQIDGFYEPKTWWQSYWQVRPIQKEYQAYAVDGHGSDDFADYQLHPVQVQMLKPYISSKNGNNQKSLDLEPPPTSRNLLGEEDQEENKLSPIKLGEQMLDLIDENE